MNDPVKFTINYRFPNKKDDLSFIIDLLGNEPKKVVCIPKPNCKENNCHNNVSNYVELYGGEKITGFYLLINTEYNSIIGVKHSIWKNTYNKILDITKFSDNRKYNVFIKTNKYLENTAIEIKGEKIYTY
jgi:hypothetical protein